MISQQQVEQIWQQVARLNEEELRGLILEFRRAQPHLGAYVVAWKGRPFDGPEIELLLYLSLMAWEILRQSERPPALVTAEHLQALEQAQIEQIHRLAQDSPGDRHYAILREIRRHPEPELLRGVANGLMEGCRAADDAPMRMRSENSRVANIHLLIVLAALIESRAQAGRAGV